MKILMLGPFMLIAYRQLKATALSPLPRCMLSAVMHCHTACVLDGPGLHALFLLLQAGVTNLERPSEQNGNSVTTFRLHSCEIV